MIYILEVCELMYILARWTSTHKHIIMNFGVCVCVLESTVQGPPPSPRDSAAAGAAVSPVGTVAQQTRTAEFSYGESGYGEAAPRG